VAEIRLWAVSITDVRGLFHATGEAADHLRGDVAFHTVRPHKRGLFSGLGPMFSRDPAAPVLAPDSPLPSDVDAILHGHFVAPDRLVPSWQIISHWLDGMSASTLRLGLDHAALDTLDFDLARAGVAAHYALRTLWARDAALPMRPLPGGEVGYQRYAVAVELFEAWRVSRPALEGSSDVVDQVVGWLQQLPTWARDAEGAGRPAPDVFAVAFA
jgi:hypothetical protein